MIACPDCGRENPDGFAFCGFCGAPLAVQSSGSVREERKVVTSLICDLVGFTESSEAADPEDVDRMLARYYDVVRAQIDGHGGVVEKFIGDAVVGVFGVPAVHEDDPERAVRAALRIVEQAERLVGVGGAPLRLRVGINTGEALVRLGVAPASGEGFLTGDSVNTAARIQSLAPEMGVLVGLATYEATEFVFDYEELVPATVKGKAEPVRVFRAKAPRARFGTDLSRIHDSPFVGREIDLAILKGVFDKTLAARSVQLVTVIGEPGLGKSRIVAELGEYVDARPDLVTWRQGRCSALRGGHHLLGAGGDPEGAHGDPRVRPAGGRAREAGSGVAGRVGARVVPPTALAVAGDRGHVVGGTGGAVHGLAEVLRTRRR